MSNSVTRRKLLSCGAAIVSGFGCVQGESGRGVSPNQTAESTAPAEPIYVENIVRRSQDSYDVTFNYGNGSGLRLDGSQFVEGNASVEPPQQFGGNGSRFTVRWVPENETTRLVWQLRVQDDGTRRVATPPLSQVREQWTLSLAELKEKFAQNNPSGLTVRTGADSRRTMYLRGNDAGGMFRIWTDGLVSYQDNEGWWEVAVDPEVLVPGSQKTNVADVQANNQYTFSVKNSPYDGSQWLSTLLRQGSHWGVNVYYFFPNHGRGTPGLDPQQPDEVYSRIRFRLGSNWEQRRENDTCKIFWAGANLSAGIAGKGGNRPTGDDGWSVRVYTQGTRSANSVALGSYVYHLDQDGEFGELRQWPDEVTIGTWNTIETYVRLNSVRNGTAQRDGVLRTYLNGTLQDQKRNFRWRTTEALGFDRLGPGSYWGGTEVAPKDLFVYYDDFRFSTGADDTQS